MGLYFVVNHYEADLCRLRICLRCCCKEAALAAQRVALYYESKQL